MMKKSTSITDVFTQFHFLMSNVVLNDTSKEVQKFSEYRKLIKMDSGMGMIDTDRGYKDSTNIKFQGSADDLEESSLYNRVAVASHVADSSQYQ